MIKPYYDHKGITIYHGDCREILPQLELVDLVLTDPPYGILKESRSAATRRQNHNVGNGSIEWDIKLEAETIHYLLEVTKIQMIWGGCHLYLPPTFGYLIWDKQIDKLNFGEAEFCWTNLKFAPRIFRYRAVNVDGGKQHPTQKPVALMRFCLDFIKNYRISCIVDPFMGSGSTLVASKQLGFRAIGIEIEEKYCEIGARRLAQEMLPFK